MPAFKISPFAFFRIEDDEVLDVPALLRGTYKISSVTRCFAYSPLRSSKYAITAQELSLLCGLSPRSWTSEEELLEKGADPPWLSKMARRGVLLSDSDDPEHEEMRRRTEFLVAQEWHPYAVFYHFMTRGEEGRHVHDNFDYELAETEVEDRARRFVAEHGPPPSPFHTIAGSERIDLPLSEKEGEIFELLARRKTSRLFSEVERTSLDDLATLLRFTFGCHGYRQLTSDVLLIHKTSPSGGSRHPIEVYPLVMHVDGLDVGLYHYDVHSHGLEVIRGYSREQARDLAIGMTAGQEYAGSAHVLFIVTARFYRNHWKYRRRSRTYGVVLMDVAHISQTLYMVATKLDLGVFFSAAIDAPRADEFLEIDGLEEAVIAVCGCGVRPDSASPDQSLEFHPFVPGETKL